MDCSRCASELLESLDRSGLPFWVCVRCQIEYLRFGERWVPQIPQSYRHGVVVRWRPRVNGYA